jgi:hypothetical protein
LPELALHLLIGDVDLFIDVDIAGLAHTCYSLLFLSFSGRCPLKKEEKGWDCGWAIGTWLALCMSCIVVTRLIHGND